MPQCYRKKWHNWYSTAFFLCRGSPESIVTVSSCWPSEYLYSGDSRRGFTVVARVMQQLVQPVRGAEALFLPRIYIYVCVYIYTYIYIHMHIYVYIINTYTHRVRVNPVRVCVRDESGRRWPIGGLPRVNPGVGVNPFF